MGKRLTAMALTIGLGLTPVAEAQPPQPTYGQMPAGGPMMSQEQMMSQGPMMGQGEMMGGQNAMMNDPQMRRQMMDMIQTCGRTMARMTEMDRTQQRNP